MANTEWKTRLNTLISNPTRKEAQLFLEHVAKPAFDAICKQLSNKDIDVELSQIPNKSISLVLKNEDVENFLYSIRLRYFEMPEYLHDDKKSYVRAEVFLLNGGQDYDVFGYTKEQIIADFISQYERHFYFLHVKNSEIEQKLT